MAKYNPKTDDFMINEELLGKVIKTFDWITFSIDSSDEEGVSKMRNPLQFRRIKFILDHIKEMEINIKINTLISKQNYKDLEKLYNFISNYQVIKQWKLFRYIKNPNTTDEINSFFEISDNQFNKIEEYIRGIQNSELDILVLNQQYKNSYISVKADGVIRVLEDKEYVAYCDLKTEPLSKFIYSLVFKSQVHLDTHFIKK